MLSTQLFKFSPTPGFLVASSAHFRRYSTRKGSCSPLVQRFASHAQRTAVISGQSLTNAENRKFYSYKQLDADSTDIRNTIHSVAGSSRDPIVLLTPNNYDFVKSLVAIWKSGSPAVPLCNTHPPAEWEYYIEDSGAKTFLVHPSYEPAIRDIASKTGGQVILTNSSSTSTAAPLAPLDWANENALFVYTSGTTGKPKGVVTTHQNVESSVLAMSTAWQWHPSDHILHVLPLHHVHGLVNALITPLATGATVEMLPKFDAHLVWNRFLQSHQARTESLQSHLMASSNPGQSQADIITVFMAVPSIYVALIKKFDSMSNEMQKLCSEALKPLRLMVSGSAALPMPILHRWEAISGHRLLERYGMTEIGMALTNPYVGGERKPGWVGKPFPGVEARIQSDEVSSSSDSVIGELYIKGPQVFKEYWKRPKATEETFTSDGWFKTGDTAEFRSSEGIYRILGRNSVDILKTGGFKVSALDIETELLDHPEIHEVAVVGIENEEWGQIVGAIVALKGEDASSGQFNLGLLQEWCKERMASYKIPRRMLVVSHIPRNAMGKVNKKELVQLFNTPTQS